MLREHNKEQNCITTIMENLPRNAVLFAAIIAAVHCLNYKDCGSSKAKIAKVSVTDCDKTPVCELKQGSTYTISVDFTPSEEVSKATTVVHGILAGIPVPFPIGNPDACKDCGITCPAPSGTQVSYHSDISVKTEYPKVKVIVKWEVKDQDNNDLVCITLPAQIVAGDKKQANHIPRENDTALRFKPHA